MRARGEFVVDFSIGDPREPTPPFIPEALKAAVPVVSQYPTVPGLPELRRAVAAYVKRRFGVEVNPNTEILPSAGSKEATFTTPLALITPKSGQAIVFGTPGYPVYERGARFAGADAVAIPLTGDFVLRAGDIPAEVWRRTAAVWICSPHNPTGSITGAADLADLIAACREHDALLLADECYCDLYDDEVPLSALEIAGPGYRNVLSYLSCSKRSGMTGYRSGAIVGDAEAIAALRDLRSSVGVASPEFVQAAAVAAWSDDAHAVERRGIFAAKRAVLRRFFEDAGLRGGRLPGRHLPVGQGGRRPGDHRAPAGARRGGFPRAHLRRGRRGLHPLRPGAHARGDPAGGRGAGEVPEPRELIDLAYEDLSRLGEAEEAVHATIAALDRGEIRVAEKVDGEWVVHEWVKRAILLYFRIAPLEVRTAGPFEYHDRIPTKHGLAEAGVRVVPPGTVRYGAFCEPGVVVMPGYVNIGARVGTGTMIDTWATVGSCAQIGRDVHLSGGVGIGGVLEPPSARPVIVEDGAFIGSRCILVEGRGDRGGGGPRGQHRGHLVDARRRRHRPRAGGVPGPGPGPRGGHPGHPPQQFPAGTYDLPCALIIGERSASTDRKTSLNEALRVFGVQA